MQRNLKRSDPPKRNGDAKRGGGAKRSTIQVHDDDGPGKAAHGESGPAWEVITTLVNGDTDPSQLLELYYWTREPGIVELIRAYLDLPEATQRSLGDFLLANRAKPIVAAVDKSGQLILSRPPARS
jgi:hypothetical protein